MRIVWQTKKLNCFHPASRNNVIYMKRRSSKVQNYHYYKEHFRFYDFSLAISSDMRKMWDQVGRQRQWFTVSAWSFPTFRCNEIKTHRPFSWLPFCNYLMVLRTNNIPGPVAKWRISPRVIHVYWFSPGCLSLPHWYPVNALNADWWLNRIKPASFLL